MVWAVTRAARFPTIDVADAGIHLSAMPSRCWPILCDFWKTSCWLRIASCTAIVPSTACRKRRVRRWSRASCNRVLPFGRTGDSRLYMIRGGRILDRTIDHSRVHHLVQSGLIRAEDAKDHPRTQPHLQPYRRLRRADCRGQSAGPAQRRYAAAVLDGLWGTLNDRHGGRCRQDGDARGTGIMELALGSAAPSPTTVPALQ